MKETETQKAIEAEAVDYIKPYNTKDFENKRIFTPGAIMEAYIAGRSKSLEEKEEEIKRLKGLIKKVFYTDMEEGATLISSRLDAIWQQFKTENNL